MPRHVAMILDGNRRWAKQQGKNPLEGHRVSALNLRPIINHLHAQGVNTVSLWAFSTENWSRDSLQVRGLMALFEEFADTYFQDAIKDETRIIHLGRKDRISESLRKKIEKYEKETAHFDKIINIALDYGGRDEVLRAVKKLLKDDISPDELTEETFNTFLDTGNQPYPEPDIIIRPGGEQRISGFMIWQGVYAEYFFPEKFLPEVTTDDLDAILHEYMHRDRRFGK